MLETLQQIEHFVGRIDAAMTKRELSQLFGEEAVKDAIQHGYLRQSQLRCDGREEKCWLTEKGRQQALG